MVFGPLKSVMDSLCHNWHNSVHNAGKTLGKYDYMAAVAHEAFERTFSSGELAKKAFAKAGIVPWRPWTVDMSKLKPSTIYKTAAPGFGPNTVPTGSQQSSATGPGITAAPGPIGGQSSAPTGPLVHWSPLVRTVPNTGPSGSQQSFATGPGPSAASLSSSTSTTSTTAAGHSARKSSATVTSRGGCNGGLENSAPSANHSSATSSGQISTLGSYCLNTGAGPRTSQGVIAATQAPVLTGEPPTGDLAAAATPTLLDGDKLGHTEPLPQLQHRKELRFELEDEIEVVSLSDVASSVEVEAAAAKIAAQQTSLTLVEAERKLHRFELTLDVRDIPIFEMLYEKKIEIENSDYQCWVRYKRAAEPAIER